MPRSVVGGASVPVRVAALGPDGKPQTVSGFQFTASAGTIGGIAPTGTIIGGTLTAPGEAQEVTLGATWNGLTASRALRVLAPLPSMTLTSVPADLPRSGGSVKITARVKDAKGTSIAGRPPLLAVDGAKASGKITDNKDGSYTTSISSSSSTDHANVYGMPAIDTSSLAPARILAWAESPTVLGDGKDATSLTLVAVDAYDLPVPNVQFALAVPLGDGTLPPSVTSDRNGIAHATYRAGTTPGIQTLHVEAAGLTTELPLFQVGNRLFVALTPGGGPDHLGALERWRKATPTLALVREGVFPPSGPPVDLQISATPGYTTPGGTIAVQVRLADEAGLGAAGQKLNVSAGPATVGPITDNRNGSYTFTVTLPAGTDAPITIKAAAGTAISSVDLPTQAQAASSKGGASSTVSSTRPSSSGGGGSKAGRSTKTSMEGPAAGRFSGTLVNTRGPYSLVTDGGGGVANADTASPDSGFFGVGLAGTYGLAVGPGRMVFGGDARFGANLYTVNGANFLAIMRDITAGARYLHPVMDNLRVGGGADFHTLTAPYYTYTSEDRVAADLAVGSWTGFRLVAQLDVDLPSGLHMSADLAESFLTAPAGTHLGAIVDVPMGDAPVAFRAGLAWDFHYLPTADLGAVGTIEEHVIAAQLGATSVLP
jgi:hypothetical protein